MPRKKKIDLEALDDAELVRICKARLGQKTIRAWFDEHGGLVFESDQKTKPATVT